MGCVLVVGCASLDTIHFIRDGKKETCKTIGGAGLYTALAVARQGADAILYAPRPEPIPDVFELAEQKLFWVGPHVSPEEMPRLEIEHHGEGRATLLGADWGAEKLLTPDCMPEIVDFDFDIVHIAALSSAAKQLEFARLFADVGQRGTISAGTYARAIGDDKESVLRLMETVDLFFMNSNEANLLFGEKSIPVRPSTYVFVSSGKDGVTIHSESGAEHIPAESAQELDPTGAGDTLCGAILSDLSFGEAPLTAATAATKLAASVVEHPGPKCLLTTN